MPSQATITQLQDIRDGLAQNDRDAVARGVIGLTEELNRLEGEERRRHSSATETSVPGASGNSDDTNQPQARRYSGQRVQTAILREQVLQLLISYLEDESVSSPRRSEIVDLLDELIEAEQQFLQTDTEVGATLDDQQEGAFLSITSVTQEDVVTADARTTRLEFTLNNYGDATGEAALILVAPDNIIIPEPLVSGIALSPGQESTITSEIQVESIRRNSVSSYLIESPDQDLGGLPPEERTAYALTNATDSFDYPVGVVIPEEKRAPQPEPRTLRDQLTNPQNQEDYESIGIFSGGIFATGAATAYRQVILDSEEGPDAENGSPSEGDSGE